MTRGLKNADCEAGFFFILNSFFSLFAIKKPPGLATLSNQLNACHVFYYNLLQFCNVPFGRHEDEVFPWSLSCRRFAGLQGNWRAGPQLALCRATAPVAEI
jgi:hypothetical protein